MPDRKKQSNLGEQIDSSDAANLGSQERGDRSSMNDSVESSRDMQGSQREGVGRASSTEVDRENIRRSSSRPGGEGRANSGTGEHVRARQVSNDPSDRTAGDEGLDSVEHQHQEGGEVNQRGASRASSGNADVESGSFAGRGAQSGRPERQAEGTGYTRDRSGQLQDDDSLSGSQGRHGRSGSRHGKSGSGTSDSERQGGQTAQNPRSTENRGSDDIDRSVM